MPFIILCFLKPSTLSQWCGGPKSAVKHEVTVSITLPDGIQKAKSLGVSLHHPGYRTISQRHANTDCNGKILHILFFVVATDLFNLPLTTSETNAFTNRGPFFCNPSFTSSDHLLLVLQYTESHIDTQKQNPQHVI